MDENFIRSLDHEYNQFLEITRTHIRQLKDQRLASICTAWIERLSACKEHEKCLRNKYIISLCYQLSKGNLDEPFLKQPADEELPPILELTSSEESTSETECCLIDSENVNTKVFLSQISLRDKDSIINTVKLERIGSDSRKLEIPEINRCLPYQKTFYAYCCPKSSKNNKDIDYLFENYGNRTNNIITKLREIKKQNVFMHNKLQELKEKSGRKDCVDKHLNKTSSSLLLLQICDSNLTVESLKPKLKEEQGVKTALMDKIKSMQKRIDNFNELKNQEIETICAKHKSDIINIKSSIKDEITHTFKKKLKNQKQEYEAKLEELQNKNTEAIRLITSAKDDDCVGKHLSNSSYSSLVMRLCDSKFALGTLKSKLKDVQDLRNALVDKIKSMQLQIDNFDEVKNQEIEKICAKHKSEIINIKSSINQEITQIFEIKLKNQKQEYEARIEELQNKNTEAIRLMKSAKDEVIAQKDKIIKQKESEIVHLLEQIRCNKEKSQSVSTKMLEHRNEEHNNHVILQNHILEKRINKMEKEKTKRIKAFESKIACLQQEKHLVECSLQIQLVHQRAQVVNDVVRDCQTETKKAVDKLEAKYQDIVASIQATAIQRRLEDQMAVASILKAASGIQTDTYCMNTSDFASYIQNCKSNKTHCLDHEAVSWCQGNNRFRGKYVPQRDTNDKA